jgi:hypothetical protein
MELPTKLLAVKAANMASPTPFSRELSNPPPSTANHQATYMSIGRNDPRAIAIVDLVRSKASNLVMDGTIFR